MTILNKLQNYRWTKKTIQDLKDFIKDPQELPNEIKNAKDYDDYKEKYRGFVVENGDKLVYKPLGLEVIAEDDTNLITSTLEKMYKKGISLGKGQNQFHNMILRHYLGIRRKDVIAFLKTKPEYQLRQTKQKTINKGIQASRPFLWWSIDLIDLNPYKRIRANKNFRYVFSCLDIFTNFAWYIPQKTKDAKYSLESFKNVLEYNQRHFNNQTIKYPSNVVSDQGKEFKGELDEFFKKHHINHTTTGAYTPQTNVEQSNGHFRQILRSLFIRTNSLAWVPHINNIMNAKNTNKIEKSGKTPLYLMNTFFENNKEEINQIATKIKAKNEERLKKYFKQENFQVGDKVRVNMALFQSKLRKRIKENRQKLNIVRFSPEIYTITKVIPVKEGKLGYTKFHLEDSQNRPITYENGRKRVFQSSNVLKISSNTSPNQVIDLTRANFLNKNRKGVDLYVEPRVVEEEKNEDENEFDGPLAPARPTQQIKVPKSSKEWLNKLKDKLFTDDVDNKRYKIVNVFYDRSLKEYVVNYILPDARNVASNREAQSLKEVLQLSQGEEWFEPIFYDFIS